jgi:hypothetical protein
LLDNIAAAARTSRTAECIASAEAARGALDQHSRILIGGSWTEYEAASSDFFQDLENLVMSLIEQNKRVILLGKVPPITSHDRYCREKALSFPFLNCIAEDNPVHPSIRRVNANLRHIASKSPNIGYFDITSQLCPGGMCSAYSPTGRLRYFDASHLSLEASWQLGREIVLTNSIPTEFESFVK